MEIDTFLHVGHVSIVWSYAETWMAFSELFFTISLLQSKWLHWLQNYGTESFHLLLCSHSATEFIHV